MNWRFVLAAVLGAVATVASRPLSSQSPLIADAAWSGSAQCQITAQAAGYSEQMTHTWTLSGGTPIAESNIIRGHAATWIADGTGHRDVTTPERKDAWKTRVEKGALVSIWVTPSNRLTIRRRAAASDPQGMMVTTTIPNSVGAPQPRESAFAVTEWPFPSIDVSPTDTTVAGTTPNRTVLGQRVSPMQPSGAVVTETCTWSFSRPDTNQSSVNRPAGPGVPSGLAGRVAGTVAAPATSGAPAGSGSAAAAKPQAGGAPARPESSRAIEAPKSQIAVPNLAGGPTFPATWTLTGNDPACMREGPSVSSVTAERTAVSISFERLQEKGTWPQGPGGISLRPIPPFNVPFQYASYEVRRLDQPDVVLERWERLKGLDLPPVPTTFTHTTTLDYGVTYEYLVKVYHAMHRLQFQVGLSAAWQDVTFDEGCGATKVTVRVP